MRERILGGSLQTNVSMLEKAHTSVPDAGPMAICIIRPNLLLLGGRTGHEHSMNKMPKPSPIATV